MQNNMPFNNMVSGKEIVIKNNSEVENILDNSLGKINEDSCSNEFCES